MANRLQHFWQLTPVLLLAVLGSSPAAGAIFDVTKTADTADGTCDDDCSLREAIIASNDKPGHDTVRIPAGTYSLVLTGALSNDGLSDDLDVFDDTTIEGAGIDKTIISGNNSFRIFHDLVESGCLPKE